MSSIVLLKSFAILNARDKPGSYFLVSIALIVCGETTSSSANLAWGSSVLQARLLIKTKETDFLGQSLLTSQYL